MARVPAGYSTVTPWIVAKDAAALINFLRDVFGAQERGARMTNPDGTIAHAEIEIGGSVIMMFDAKPTWPDTPAFLRVYVDDVDATFKLATEQGGAAPVTEPTTLAFGDRVCRVRDPWDNVWWIHQHIEDVDEATMMRRFQDPAAIEAMQYVERTLNDAMSERPARR